MLLANIKEIPLEISQIVQSSKEIRQDIDGEKLEKKLRKIGVSEKGLNDDEKMTKQDAIFISRIIHFIISTTPSLREFQNGKLVGVEPNIINMDYILAVLDMTGVERDFNPIK